VREDASRGAASGVTPLVAPLPFRNLRIGRGVAVLYTSVGEAF
jgi:hypothetical protein